MIAGFLIAGASLSRFGRSLAPPFAIVSQASAPAVTPPIDATPAGGSAMPAAGRLVSATTASVSATAGTATATRPGSMPLGLEGGKSPNVGPASAAIVGSGHTGAGPTPESADPARTPHFDIVRVEPNGDTVLAGQGAPNVTIELVAAGKVLAEASSDATGHFVMLPPALAPGDYALTLRQPVAGTMVESAQAVTVSVPARGKGSVLVALAEPGQATRVLSPLPGSDIPAPNAKAAGAAATPPGRHAGPSSAQAAPAEAGTAVLSGKAGTATLAIRSVELENGNGFFASGVAAPGTKLHVYLNDSHLAEVVAGGDAGWSVKIRKGLPGGHYVVRADASGDGRTVTARVEVPFDVPVAAPVALATPAPAARLASAGTMAPTGAVPGVVPEVLPGARPGAVSEAMSGALSLASSDAGDRGTLSVAEADGVVPALKPGVGGEVRQTSVAANPPQVAAAGQDSATSATSATSTGTATDVVIDEVTTAVVRTGDNLWDISRIRLGHGWRYTRIYAANAAQIRDPQLIYPGQVFVLPSQND